MIDFDEIVLVRQAEELTHTRARGAYLNLIILIRLGGLWVILDRHFDLAPLHLLPRNTIQRPHLDVLLTEKLHSRVERKKSMANSNNEAPNLQELISNAISRHSALLQCLLQHISVVHWAHHGECTAAVDNLSINGWTGEHAVDGSARGT